MSLVCLSLSKVSVLYRLSGCSSSGIRTREMHTSFPDNVTVRRVVLLNDQPPLLPKIAHLHRPEWMLATAYSDVETMDGDDGLAVCIDTVELLPGASGCIVATLANTSAVFNMPNKTDSKGRL